MPSVSAKQHRLMAAVAHDPKFARKVGIAASVGKDFMAADDAAGITRHPSMPQAQQRARIERMKAKDSARSPVQRLRVPRGEAHREGHREPRTHVEFERLGNPTREEKSR